MKPDYKDLQQKARAILQDKKLLAVLLRDAAIKADRNKSKIREFWANLKALVRMTQASIRREYRQVPVKSLLAAIAAILYFLNPFDLIPDFLPGGFIDDALFVGWVLAAIRSDIERFLVWEKTVPIRAVRVDDKIE